MDILAWFGRYDPKKCHLEPFASLDQRIQALAYEGLCPRDQYLRELAKSTGFFEKDSEYNAQVCETAIALVKRQLESRATEEADLLKAAGALNDLDLAINLLDERLFEWSRLHIDKIVHGKELAASLQEDKVMGELARLLIELRASRQRSEENVGDMATKLAPNLAMIAGPNWLKCHPVLFKSLAQRKPCLSI
jgi:RNA processing factor Prp31